MQDGNIHCHINNVSKKAERVRDRSAVAAASYIAGIEIFSDKEQRYISVRDEDRVIFDEILTPPQSPEWASDRALLWNRVEASAKRSDARLAKKIEVAFTRDIPPNLRIELLREFASLFVDMGCVVDVAIHADDADHNPHAHLLLTTRKIDGQSFGAKINSIDQRKFITDTRAHWAALSNKYLKQCGSAVRVDHRSYKARGIGLEPTLHRGAAHPLNQEHDDRSTSVRERSTEVETPRQNKEEHAMAQPTTEEKRDYPNLTARDTWPPQREAAQDMSPNERSELDRYWQEKDAEEIQRLANDFDMEHDLGFPEPELKTPAQDKFAVAVQRATSERHSQQQDVSAARDIREEEKIERDFRAERAAQHDDIYRRAMALKRTQRENDFLHIAKYASPELKEFVRDQFIRERMQKIQDADNARRRAELEKVISETEKRQFAEILNPEKEQDFPEQGPNKELLPAHEIETARDRMLREVEATEPEYEHKVEFEKEWERDR